MHVDNRAGVGLVGSGVTGAAGLVGSGLKGAGAYEGGMIRYIVMDDYSTDMLFISTYMTVNLTGKAGGNMAKHMNSFTSPAKKSFFSSRKSSPSN